MKNALKRVVVLLHDVSSAQRLIDMARLVYGMGLRELLVSKAYGAAASSGIPEVSRLALKLGRVFAVLPGARDAVEVTGARKIIVVSRDYGEPTELPEIARMINEAEEPVLLVFGGIDPAPSKDVAVMGDAVYIKGLEERVGPVAEAAMILAALKNLLS